jgi:outer membrane cobalamin receptor
LNENNKFQLQINAKKGTVSNWIQWIPTPEDLWMAMNFKTVNVQQAEGVFTWKRMYRRSYWMFSERAEYTDATGLNTNNFEGYQMVYTPQIRFNSSLTLSRDRWKASFDHSFLGRRFTDEGNTTFYALPSFNLFNFSLSKEWQFKKNMLSSQFEIQNLSNIEYQWLRGYAMPGRVYSLSIKFFIH